MLDPYPPPPGADASFFVIALARPLVLSRHAASGVSVEFLLDDDFRRTVRFWDDPVIPRITVNLTCQRCPLDEDACRDRVAPPLVARALEQQKLRERIGISFLARILLGMGGP